MKKFLIGIVAFFVAVATIDFGFGRACKYLIVHAKAGFTQSHEYVANHCNEDVLIFGSSRAIHHYVPSVISDSLGMSCYNCGMDGNGILYLYSRYLMVTNRYNPRLIIYDVLSSFDLSTDDYTKYLGWQKRYCSIPGVMDVITDVNPMERWKLKSNLYRYNGNFIQLLTDNLHPVHVLDSTGYEPLYKVMDYDPEIKMSTKSIHWDEKKKSYFEKLVADCKCRNITLIFAYSPMYGMENSNTYAEFTEFCKNQCVTLLDYYSDEDFVHNKEYFADSNHLNDTGAREYTKEVAVNIRDILKK